MQAFDEVLDQIRVHGFVVYDDPLVEARHNTYLLTVSSDIARTLTVDRVTEFLDRARGLLASGARESHRPLRFYAWFDELAGQLRFSVSSAADLPFGAAIDIASDSALIARQFLQSDSLDGVPWSELSEVAGDDAGPATETKPLDVFVAALA